MNSSVILASAFATALALSCVGTTISDGSPALVRRNDFIRAYVRCNNEAWSGVSHALIPYRFSTIQPDVAAVEPEIRGFFSLGYLNPKRTLQKPESLATLEWAASVKAYADDGGIERGFARRDTANAYLRENAPMLSTRELSDFSAANLATNLRVALLRGNKHTWVLYGFQGARLNGALTVTSAAGMLRFIGSHEAVGSRKTVAAPVRQCSVASAVRFLTGKWREA